MTWGKKVALASVTLAAAGAGAYVWARRRRLPPAPTTPEVPAIQLAEAKPPSLLDQILGGLGKAATERVQQEVQRFLGGQGTSYPAGDLTAAYRTAYRAEGYRAAYRAGDPIFAAEVQAVERWWTTGAPVDASVDAVDFAIAPALAGIIAGLGSAIQGAVASGVFSGVLGTLGEAINECFQPFEKNKRLRQKLGEANKNAFSGKLQPLQPRSRPSSGPFERQRVEVVAAEPGNPAMQPLVIPFDQEVTVSWQTHGHASGFCHQEVALVQILANQGGQIVPVWRKEAEGIARFPSSEPKENNGQEKIRLTAGQYILQAIKAGASSNAKASVEFEAPGAAVGRVGVGALSGRTLVWVGVGAAGLATTVAVAYALSRGRR